MLEIKEESISAKNELDKEIKERRAEIQRNERRIVAEGSEYRQASWKPVEKREAGFAAKEEEINKQKDRSCKAYMKSVYRN